jgi:two-component system chemotaxis sensor kinase CheA
MLKTRMVPARVLFDTVPRLVRDLARATGKQAELTIDGEDTEIDRSVIEQVKGPLIHLVRNAVDHGIEAPEARRAAGKPEAGRITLTARHAHGQIQIELCDDGAGIDPRRVAGIAAGKGLIAPDAAARVTASEAAELIFSPGFSTAAQATDVSGRGVGMDVVRNSIRALSGSIDLESELGHGTTVRLHVPLTLATFSGLIVESDGHAYAFPLSYVQETGRLEDRFVSTIVDKEVVHLRGQVLPLVRLRALSGAPSVPVGVAPGEAGAGYMVVVNVGGRPSAIAVDALVRQQEIVVKPLGRHAGRAHGVSGASILGDGQMALIVDVAELVKAA